MDPNYIEILIFGQSYYIPANRLRDLAYIEDRLVNISDTSITMVNNFRYYDQTNYPRITCAAMSPCRLSYSYNNTYLVETRYQLVNNVINFNSLGINGWNTIIIALLTILVGLKLLQKK